MAARQFWVDIDLRGNQLINVVLEPLSTDPAGKLGRMYFNSNTKKMMVYNGTAWVSLAGSINITNVGTGVGVWKATSDSDVELKSIKGGSGVLVTSLANEVQVAIDSEATLSGSTTKIPTSSAVKTYVDSVKTYTDNTFVKTSSIDTDTLIDSSTADNRVPSTKAVKRLVSDMANTVATGVMQYVGTFDASKGVWGNITSSIKKGQFWVVNVAGDSASGIKSPSNADNKLNVGDMLIANRDVAYRAEPSLPTTWNDIFDVIDNTEAPNIVRLDDTQELTNKTISADDNVISGLNGLNFRSSDVLNSFSSLEDFVSALRPLSPSSVVGEGLIVTLMRSVVRSYKATITQITQSVSKTSHKMGTVLSANIYDGNGALQVVDITINQNSQTVSWSAMNGFAGGYIIITGFGI